MVVLATLASLFSLGLGLTRTPYLGVDCPYANTTTCGRVGIAVWLKDRPTAIEASIGKAHVRLRAPSPPNVRAPWVGYVHLPLRAMGIPASWTGSARPLRLHLRVERAGTWQTGTVRALLYPGFG
jgi:hypothetical protein